MLDFVKITHKTIKKGVVEVYPKFIVKDAHDILIRGGDFYAVWNEEKKLWSPKESELNALIDRDMDNYAKELRAKTDDSVIVSYMWDCDSKSIDRFHKYCKQQMRDSDHSILLDNSLIFSNTERKKEDYATKYLPYSLSESDISSYNELMSVLYTDEERRKIEWAIGSIISGDSKTIQKFMVLYGGPGTGKSTVLNIIQKLFEGYFTVFDAKALGSSNASFALEPFRNNPLVAIQHDGDLSKIDDNTRLNSIASHEYMTINEKFKSSYTGKFNCFMFMGTNKPVRITDAKSGLIRRLIDVTPTGKKVGFKRYNQIMSGIDFELGGIAYHCLQVYNENKHLYDDYIPVNMMGATNDIFNFMLDKFDEFDKENMTTLQIAWDMWNEYKEASKISYDIKRPVFKEEIKEYFEDYKERWYDSNGNRLRKVYIGFKHEKFTQQNPTTTARLKREESWLKFDCKESLLDDILKDCPAQLANANGKPRKAWDDVKTTLKDINTSLLHYVRPPLWLIVIDFDLAENGVKSFEKNLEAASKFPKTYAELSKSGNGIHLHYIYEGDPTELSSVYGDNIEIKVFNGKSSLRRQVSLCNDIPVATLTSGLPLKEVKNVVNNDIVFTEKYIRNMIIKNLNKEIHGNTAPSVQFIFKILEDAYASGVPYDVSNMEPEIRFFAKGSSHQKDFCEKLVDKMKFKSKSEVEEVYESLPEDAKLVFFDVETAPNLFLVCYKIWHEDKVYRLFNPSPTELEALMNMNLAGFYNREYDNHMIYACKLGYSNADLFMLNKSLIGGNNSAKFPAAYNLSFIDIFDMCSKKQSLKKWEIELGIFHNEWEADWDEPVPEELWEKFADYCCDDVRATEKVFDANVEDFNAKKMLVRMANIFAPNVKSTLNDKTNTLTSRIIFKGDKHPQDKFVYTDLRKEFPGYEFKNGVSTYRGEEVGEGGYVYVEEGMYYSTPGHGIRNDITLDVASMHPSSAIAMNIFGDEYTQQFAMLKQLRILIKHKDYDKAKALLGSNLFDDILDNPEQAKQLAQALKIAINMVYGMTAAKFDNAFKDPRNIDNIVAKRGALFMVNLKHEVQDRGFTVIHIKTDSIKIHQPTDDIIKFVINYGKQYGYDFEVEDEWEKFCIVNKATYVGKTVDGKWETKADQFNEPYVFKSLFSKEEITFRDMCITNSVSGGAAMYLDFNENLPDVSKPERVKKLRRSMAKKTKSDILLLDSYKDVSDEELGQAISVGHDYKFVGKVGMFVPVLPGTGGGLLMRISGDNKSYVSGSKGYRWMEATMVRTLGLEDKIDRSYFINLVDAAKAAIEEYGDFEVFCN